MAGDRQSGAGKPVRRRMTSAFTTWAFVTGFAVFAWIVSLLAGVNGLLATAALGAYGFMAFLWLGSIQTYEGDPADTGADGGDIGFDI